MHDECWRELISAEIAGVVRRFVFGRKRARELKAWFDEQLGGDYCTFIINNDNRTTYDIMGTRIYYIFWSKNIAIAETVSETVVWIGADHKSLAVLCKATFG